MEAKLKVIQENPQIQALLSQYPDLATADPLTQKQTLLKAMTERPDLFQTQNPHREGEMDSEGGVYITPAKAYVIKTSDSKTQEKVFINICSHELIDAPEEKELPDMPDEQQVGLRIPLSLGNPRPDFDKSED
jgi:hypothetical protein